MPKFSANIGMLWPDRPLLQRIEAAAGAGFRAIEMHWPYETPAADVATLSRRLNLRVLGINTAPGDLTRGERGLAALIGREAQFRAGIAQSVEYAVACGAGAVHVMAGVVPMQERTAARELFVANLRMAAQMAAAHNLTLLLEPLNARDAPGYFYSTVQEAAGLIEEIGQSNVKIQFDAYHVAITEGDLIMKLRRFFSLIGNVQIAAVPSRAEPDEGEIAYRALFAELDRLGYDGWVGCEYRPRGDTDEGLRWTRTLGVSL